MRHPVAFLACLCAIVLSGCIEGEETIWLERDGSGRIEAVYTMPPAVLARLGGAEALKQQLLAASAADEHVDLTSVECKTERGSVTFTFAGTFDHLQELCEFPRRRLRDPATPDVPAKSEALFGDSQLTISDLSLQLRRKIDLSGVLPESIARAPSLLRDSAFRYTVHLPVEVGETDATVVSNDGKTLQWTFPLRDYTDRPMSLVATAPLPIPWWVWIAGALLAIAILAILFLAVRRAVMSKR